MADTQEEIVTYLNVDAMAAARGTAWRAAGELGGDLPESELRTVLVGVVNKVAEVFDRLMAHAVEAGVGELDVAALPEIEELFADGELEVEVEREYPPTRAVTFGAGDDAGSDADDNEGAAAAEADQDPEGGDAEGVDPSEVTVDELKDRAKTLGLTGVSKLNKADLAAAVAAAEADQDPED